MPVTSAQPWFDFLSTWASREQLNLLALARGTARSLPAVLIVPAFGARVLPVAARVTLALGLGWLMAPLLTATGAEERLGVYWLLAQDLALGLPTAIASAALLWAATDAGALVSDLRGGSSTRFTLLQSDSPALGGLFGLLAAASFLALGGPERLVSALGSLEPGNGVSLLRGAAVQLVAAIQMAVGLGAPMLVAAAVWEICGGLIARAAAPAFIQPALAPLRALVVLAVLALAGEGLVRVMGQGP